MSDLVWHLISANNETEIYIQREEKGIIFKEKTLYTVQY